MSITLKESEAQAFYNAADELYDIYVEAADYVIENDLFFELDIPFNLVEAIKKSWENDVHWHIYGAFQFSGGLNNTPIKLEGFDADTPKNLLATSQEQLDETHFNEIYEKVSTNFKRLITLDEGIDLFEERYDGWKILFSAPADDEKQEEEMLFLEQMAQDAGFETAFSYLHEVVFNEDGIFDAHDEQYEYWFKSYKWHDMGSQEPELATLLTSIMKKQSAIILNPAYCTIFESKGFIEILKKICPDSPYLQKNATDTDLIANVYFAYEACGLSFLKNGLFTTHKIA